MIEINHSCGVTPLPKASLDTLGYDKLGWQALADNPDLFIPKGFSLVTQGELQGMAAPEQVHGSEADANQTHPAKFKRG